MASNLEADCCSYAGTLADGAFVLVRRFSTSNLEICSQSRADLGPSQSTSFGHSQTAGTRRPPAEAYAVFDARSLLDFGLRAGFYRPCKTPEIPVGHVADDDNPPVPPQDVRK